MSFNLEISNQAHENFFPHKRSIASYPPVTLNNTPVAQTNSPKDLGIQLDKKLNFKEHHNKVESKIHKAISIICKLQNVLTRLALLTIYKSFIRPYLDHGDIIYDKAFNDSFHAKLVSLQYNTTLTITGAIRGSSTRVQINFSELHGENLCEKKLLVLVSHKGPQWLGLRDRIF